MSNSYRIRTTVGSDKSIKVRIDQDFDHLEILSLKLLQNDVYTRQCSDYGVIVGRVSINNGFGIPNARVSIFIPLSDDDEVNNPVLSNLYPYKTLSQIDDDGYRYNLLPKEPSHSNHVPTGTFFTREEVLTNPTKVEIYEKYYKYNSITNESGDYMIYGVPLGSQTIVVNVDLSDIGDFSLTPQDLIRMGVASPKQVGGTKFSSSNNFNQLPQIITINRTIDVQPFWGDENICVLGITRTDFDLSAEKNIVIQPTAVFMGSIFTTADETPINRLCNIDTNFGNMCELSTGPGQITAIRQTIFTDVNGRPGLEVATLEDGGQVIDGNGAWVIDVPMNLDYVTTNEFGEQVISIDPTVGIPTKGKYRFKISWSQSPDLGERIKRASYLVPNIKEYGWNTSDGIDPYTNRKVKSGNDYGNDDNPCVFNPTETPNTQATYASYAFSLDWNDYGQTNKSGVLTPLGEKMVLEAINCEDRFFEMRYNKVYTVSQLYSEYRKAMNNSKFMGIKNILDDSCESSTNRFPTNDAVYVGDTIFVLFQILILIVYIILFFVIFLLHLIIFIVCSVILPIVQLFEGVICGLYGIAPRICLLGACITLRPFGFLKAPCDTLKAFSKSIEETCRSSSLDLPMITYPSCDLCACEPKQPEETPPDYGALAQVPSSELSDVLNPSAYLDDDSTQFLVTFMTGVQTESGKPKVGDRAAPGNLIGNEPNPNSVQYHSSDLPWFERINLFNVKAKYFNSNADNPGGGVNRIGVRFDVDNNGGPLPNVVSTILPTSNCHMDNVIALLLDSDAGDKYAVGKLLSFQDPSLSADINVDRTLFENPFGFNAITGETIGNRSGDDVINNISVYYAKPDASITGPNNSDPGNNLSTSYKIVSKYAITSHMFPIDIEYFQVIHNESVNDYITGANAIGTPDLPNSFLDRIVDGKFYYFVTTTIPSCNPVPALCLTRYWYDSITPVPLKTKFNDFNNLRVVFLVRGVDPNSPKVTNSYDLSRLYGYKSWGKKVVTIKDVKMNIPIRGNHKCTQHNIPSSITKDTYAKSTLFFDTFNWQPSISSPQIGPGIDPTTVTQYDPVTGDPLDGKKYNPPTEDPDYRPANAYSFTPFKTTLHHYYSSIDNQYFNTFEAAIPRSYMVNTINLQKPLSIKGNNNSVINGVSNNAHTIYYDKGALFNLSVNNTAARYFVPYNNNSSNNRGYFSNEIVDGGNVSYLGANKLTYTTLPGFPVYVIPKTVTVFQYTRYYSQTYESMSGSGVIPNVKPMEIKLGTSKRQIVMRSDRLPGSTSPETGLTSTHISYTLAGNNGFAVYEIKEDGTFDGPVSTIGSGASGDLAESRAGDKCGDNILAQFECKTLTPLSCYYTDNTNKIKSYPFVKPIPNDRDQPSGCWGNGVDAGTSSKYGSQPELILESGCYKLVTVPWKTLIIDYALLIEWRARIVISYAACRGIFSHSFSNNWVNGSLFAFSFINARRFTKPDKNKKISNKPFNCFCKNNIILTPSNNFYYRSSPYSEVNGFIGRKAPVGYYIKTIYGNNEKNLMWPTTMMDLGPRDKFTQEIVSSNDYDGYVVNSLRSTSYQDNTQLLNTLLISRMVNTSFIDAILKAIGVTAVFRYFSRENKKVDGDYSQAISSNSEIGTISFGEDNYSSCDLYLSRGDSGDNVFGVYWKTNNQIRDYITPKRNIISEETMFNNISSCSMEYFPVKTQVVPFYQWFVQHNDNTGTVSKITDALKLGGPWDSVYGSQINDWMTTSYSSTTFFNYGYQNLDRLNQNSRYFRPKNSITKYRKGLISGVNANGDNSGDVGSWDVNTDPYNAGTMVQRVVNTGAPFHFYFGLLKGKSSLDKFVSKWVEAEINLD